MLKVVIDTSVFVSALLSKSQISSPYLVLQAWQQGKFTLDYGSSATSRTRLKTITARSA